MGKVLDEILPVAAAAATAIATGGSSLLLPALAAGATQTGVDYSQNHNIGPDLLNGLGTAGGAYLGNAIGSNLFPVNDAYGSALAGSEGNTLPQIGGGTAGAAGSTAGVSTAAGGIQSGGSLSNFLGNSLANNLGMSNGGTLSGLVGDYAPGIGTALSNTGTGTALGTIAGGQLGNSLTTPPPAAPTPWSAGYEGYQPLPANLTGVGNNPNLSGLTSDQQASYIASQGLFGGGNGADEQNYFSHLINNQLVPQGGNSQQGNPISSLEPVENTYLQKLGFNLNDYGNNPTSLLQALSQWTPA